MNRRDIFIGIVVLLLAVVLVFWFRGKTPKSVMAPTPVSEEKIEKSFNLTIPEDVDKVEMNDVSGGDASGVATRKYENGNFSHMVLADLSDPEAGTFYEGWLVKGKMGDEDFAYISTGRMVVAKGGYLLEYKSSTDYSDYTGVVITLEKVNDKKPETHILEGSF